MSNPQKEKLVLANRGLVASVVKKYARNSEEFKDFFQDGMIGLIRAMEYYDPNRPTKLSTMAMPWIRKYVKKAVIDRRIVHVPSIVQYRSCRMQKLHNKVYARTGIEVLQKSDMAETCLLVEDTDTGSTFMDLSFMDHEEYKHVMNIATEILSFNESRVFKMRLEGIMPTEIAKKLGVSKQRVSQIFNKASEKVTEEVMAITRREMRVGMKRGRK